MTTLRFNRDDLIEALEGRRPWAADYDAKVTAEHKAAEKEWHKRFVARCRELARMPYEEVKAIQENSYRGYGFFGDLQAPSCPTSRVAQLDKVLNIVRAGQQATYSVSKGGQWNDAFWLLTHDDTISEKVC